MTLVTTNDPRTFNQWIAAETSSTNITNLLHSGLLRRNQHTLEFEPAMAERWEFSPDQRSVTFTLREGLRWSDGRPLTAEDFVFSAEIITHPDVESNQTSGQLVAGEFARWQALNSRTVRVAVNEVYAGLLSLSTIQPAPRHVLEQMLRSRGFATMNSYWERDEAGNRLRYLDEVVFAVVPDNDTALQRFLAGQIDIYGNASATLRGED